MLNLTMEERIQVYRRESKAEGKAEGKAEVIKKWFSSLISNGTSKVDALNQIAVMIGMSTNDVKELLSR